jgi:predicted secreted protein with PEFG-CTERM motif
MLSNSQKTLFASILLLLLGGMIIPNSFAQSSFDSKTLGLGMPSIDMTPIYGTPSTEVEISIENMPEIPKNLDPRVEFFVFLPFFSPLDSDNVPQTCNGEKCFPLYSFEEIQEGKLPSKKITFTLFGKQNPKSIVESGLVQSVCDLKINGQTVERFGYSCNEKDQPTGEYQVKFGWGIQQSDIFDIRETKVFTVISEPTSEEITPGSLDDALIKEFQSGLITVAQFQNGLEQLDYSDQNIRQTKGLLNLLDHQFASLSSDERKKITQACDDLRGSSRIYAVTDKEKYAPSDTIYVQGCVDPVIPSQELNVQILNSNEKLIDAKLIPEVDGSFYTKFLVDDKFSKNGTYATEIIYGDQKKTTSFVVPEFSSMAVLILLLSVITAIIISRMKSGFFQNINIK